MVQWIEQDRLDLEDVHVIPALVVNRTHFGDQCVVYIVLNDDDELVGRLVEDFLRLKDVLHIIIHIIRPDWLCNVVLHIDLFGRIQLVALLQQDVELVIRIHRVQLVNAKIGVFGDFKALTLEQVEQNVARQVEARNEWFSVVGHVSVLYIILTYLFNTISLIQFF